MKKIYKIARTELRTLFFSPIAWLILIIFTIQVSLNFTTYYEGWVKYILNGKVLGGISMDLFANPRSGLFVQVQSYLYLYLPLITMALMSKDFASGSIKLLYSSPVTNTQIVLGKFLSMMIYGSILIAILFLYVLFCWITVTDFEIKAILSGLLGLYFLILAYAAIGLFMSSLTSYQVVAAIGTFTIFAILNYMSVIGQDIPFVRTVTYWLSISGRSSNFIYGLICSEDVFYFITVVALFLSLCIVRLQVNRQKTPLRISSLKYMSIAGVAVCVAFITTQPKLMGFYDATSTKTNTLTPKSQEVIKQLKGDLTITTYANLFDTRHLNLATPRSMNVDLARFKQYTRFKPEIKMKYVYYYDTIHNEFYDKYYPDLNLQERMEKLSESYDLKPKLFLSPEQISKKINLHEEGNRFVRNLKHENGKQTFLRVYNDMYLHPGEKEITAALKRLARKPPKVGFLAGHQERSINRTSDRDYNQFVLEKTFRNALINQGFDVTEIYLNQNIPGDVDILVVSDIRRELTDVEKETLSSYIEKGGNIILSVKPNRYQYSEHISNYLGINFVPGILVSPNEDFIANLTLSRPTVESTNLFPNFQNLIEKEQVISMPGAVGIEYNHYNGFINTPVLVSNETSWNELETTNFTDDTVIYNPGIGELQKSYITGLAMSRFVGNKEQKVIVLGDADCISNGEINIRRRNIYASNYTLIFDGFSWLTDYENPIDVSRPPLPDYYLSTGKQGMKYTKISFLYVLPGLLVIMSLLLWIRRRGR